MNYKIGLTEKDISCYKSDLVICNFTPLREIIHKYVDDLVLISGFKRTIEIA